MTHITFQKPEALTDGQKKMVKGFVDISKAHLRQFDELAPVCVLMNSKDNAVHMVVPVFSTLEEKDLVFQEIRRKALDIRPDVVLMLMESWTLPADKTKEFMQGQKEGKWSQVSEHPEAYEAVTYMLETRKGSWFCAARIHGEGRDRYIDDSITLIHSDQVEGRMTNFIPVKEVLGGYSNDKQQ